MLRFIYGDGLHLCPELARGMFRDRAAQFHRRLKWPVSVDDLGREQDEYDALNPLYVIWQLPDGSHGGSMRFLPTVGPTMVNEHFLNLTDGVAIHSPLIWETTRFCLAQGVDTALEIPAKLMLAAVEIGRRFYLNHAVGVFDAPMMRVYRGMGWAPDLVNKTTTGIAIGLWDFKTAPMAKLQNKSGLSLQQVQTWLDTDLHTAGLRAKSA